MKLLIDAIGTGTGVAIESSDLTLMRGELSGVPTAIRLSRRSYRTVLQNLGWAFGYNVVAIPLAALGLLNPIIAGTAVGFSSVSVVTNSLRLQRIATGLLDQVEHLTEHVAAIRDGGPPVTSDPVVRPA